MNDKQLTAAADRAEQVAERLGKEVVELERAVQAATARVSAALEAGEPSDAASRERDQAEGQLSSRRRDHQAALRGALAVRAKAERAVLDRAVASLNGRLTAAAQNLETAFRAVARAVAAWQSLVDEGRDLAVELRTFGQRFGVIPDAPTAGTAAMTEDLLDLGRDVVAQLRILDERREEAAHPAPPPESPAPPYLIAGMSERALRQREELAESARR